MEDGKHQHSAKTLFWYFSLFWTLGITAFAVGAVWFQVINNLFPLEVTSYGIREAFNQELVKGALAAIIVGAPVFFLFAFLIRKAIDKGLINLIKGPRQWVSYLILFIVVAVAIGDVIASVMAFLNGDFTARFLLKSLVILIITGIIFAYFWMSLKSKDALAKSIYPKIGLGVAVIMVLASLIAGFVLIDSPAVSRDKSGDQQRISDLRQIQYSVDSYYARFEALPESLNELAAFQPIPTDPISDQPYTYEIIDAVEYKLCATFKTSNEAQSAGTGYDSFFLLHGAGENCFSFIANDNDPYQLKDPLPVPIR